MALARGGDPFEVLGTAPPAVAARSADLLIVAGSITRRQVPILRALYERLLAPRWVMAWGACAISGGAYQNYATVSGLSRVLPVDVHVAGCPPEPADLLEALRALRRVARDGGRVGVGASRQPGSLPIGQDEATGRSEPGAGPFEQGMIQE